MELRKEIEPDFKSAEKHYPEVLKLILAYSDYCEENGDEDSTEYQKLENTLHEMTGKDMSQFNLWEWWEEEGAEVLAFRISLPAPKVIEHITKGELTEIVRRQKTFVIQDENDKSLRAQFHYHLDDYFIDFLSLNFTTFDHSLFQRQKDKKGNYFEYNQNEIVEKLWNMGKYK
ncbi:MAG: hypothetical protein K0R59_1352 [Sphingobacterium sp.]|jgi:hypothetical protein|uniref:hypothetical protein n=1 Tax=unclassified Sphingobacterium TaxID=2609468 RepID=UPI0009867E4E|nr:hypothetical protein [Sphingobacterium sp. CZ-UAM]MDF2516056.1 hypothetical protein [Sphingobacterium sp.]OOG18740.1 hypothetical protein BWD42_01895 [Sphingobacterium sp. CZ-UAM]